jgi:hypothetical protein
MSSLKLVERACLEELFDMASGYVMDFSNRTFSEFFREAINIDIYAEKYSVNGESKARRLRSFWEIEADAVVGKAVAELIEYWRYFKQSPTAQQIELSKTATRIAERLLGRPNLQKDSGKEFLEKEFGPISLRDIPSAAPLVTILEARMTETLRCFAADSPLAVIFHCGSILEGLLLGVAVSSPRQFNQSSISPKDKTGDVKPLHQWTLSQLIDVACELGYLRLDVKKFSHALRDFRNYIHPYEQMSAKFDPDMHTAKICLQVLKAATSSLSKKSM